MKAETLMKPVTVLIALIAAVLLLHPTLTAADESIAGAEHWVQSVSGVDGKPIKLYVWEKRLKAGDPSAFARSGKSAAAASSSSASPLPERRPRSGSGARHEH